MRHKRILDVASENPNASVDELARAVPSATPELVERVLEQYGDPASDSSAEEANDDSVATTDTTSSNDTVTKPDGGNTNATDTSKSGAGVSTTEAPTDSDDNAVDVADVESSADTTEREAGPSGQTTTAEKNSDTEPAAESDSHAVDPADLTATERETLRAIQADPEATQRALAESLGVSAATVSQRVNGIDGFEWSDRASFAEAVFDTKPADTASPASIEADGGDDVAGESIAETLSALHGQMETLTEQQSGQKGFEDPELISKIVHACMDAETITEDEELRIIRTLIA